MGESQDKRKSVDNIRGARKVTRLRVSYVPKFQRIKIDNPARDEKKLVLKAKTKKVFLLCLACLIVLSVLTFGLAKSPIFQMLSLIKKVRNGSYIVGFQNSAELRPTGGFWGSFAYVDVPNDLRQTQIYFETNPYKKDNPLLTTTNVEMPKPMKEVWPDRPQSFVNANWSPDFVDSAKTIEWYFGQGWDKKSDGVIAVSSLSMIDLLQLTGPIQLSDGTEIRSENFSQIMSQKIDIEYWYNPENKTINEPKTIIKDLAPIIIEKAKKIPPLKMIRFISNQFKYGRILLYFNDTDKQQIVKNLKLSGEMLPYKVDYLQINNANLGGNKTSLNVFQNISYKVSQSDDSYIGTLEITRDNLPNLLPNHLNRNYTRVFVPLGSKIISAESNGGSIMSELDQTEEYGRSVFGFWFKTSPSEKRTVKIIYKLPFELNEKSDYHLLIQKQSGTNFDTISLDLPSKKINGFVWQNKTLSI